MLSDPQTITINAIAVTLNRISTSGLGSSYSNADQTIRMEVSHTQQKNGRIRTLVKLIERKLVTNPLDSKNDYDTTSVHVVIDRPNYGWTTAQIQQLVAGLQGWMSGVQVARLVELQH